MQLDSGGPEGEEGGSHTVQQGLQAETRSATKIRLAIWVTLNVRAPCDPDSIPSQGDLQPLLTSPGALSDDWAAPTRPAIEKLAQPCAAICSRIDSLPA
jgi:hypothetical protein